MIILVFLLFLGKYLKIVIEAIFYRHNSLFIKLLKQSSFGLMPPQGRRIKLRCPPKVLTGTLHPSLPSIFSG